MMRRSAGSTTQLPVRDAITRRTNSSNDSSSYDLSMGCLDFQPPLFKLVVDLRWAKLARILKRKRNRHRCQARDEAGVTLIGVALAHRAPLDIIRLIVEADPDQLAATDLICGANSLHIACLTGSPHAIVSYILEQCGGTLASTRDKDNRSPLHHVTECICRNGIDLSEGLKVVDSLCRSNCTMIHTLDIKDQSPLDIVHNARCQCSDLSPEDRSEERKRLAKLCRFLQKISCRVYRLKKLSWENTKPFSTAELEEGGMGESAGTFSTTSSTSFLIDPQDHDCSNNNNNTTRKGSMPSMGKFIDSTDAYC